MAWHAKLSASGTKQWLTCPGSAAYIMHHKIPTSSSGFAAQEGTAAHFLIETCLREGSEPVDYIGRMIEVKNGSDTFFLAPKAKKPRAAERVIFTVDEDMVYATTRMTNYVRSRLDELGLDMGVVKLETKVHPLSGDYQDLTGGTGDVVIDAWPRVLEVVDYKHGRGVYVPVEGNYQAQSYMLGAMREAQEKHNDAYVQSYAEFRYTICQPRHTQAPEGGVSSEVKTAEELMEFKNRLQDGVDRVLAARSLLEKDPTMAALHKASYLQPGEFGDACTFCPLKATIEYGDRSGKVISCPALLDAVNRQAGLDFSDDALEVYTDNSEALQKAQSLNPDALKVERTASDLATVLSWLPVIEAWAKEVKAAAEGRALQGEVIPGWKVVEKKGRRSWRSDLSETQIVKQLMQEFKLHKDDLFAEPKLLTGPQVEKLIDKPARKNFNEKLLSAGEPEKIVVPESDKRPAVEVRPGQDFENI